MTDASPSSPAGQSKSETAVSTFISGVTFRDQSVLAVTMKVAVVVSWLHQPAAVAADDCHPPHQPSPAADP